MEDVLERIRASLSRMEKRVFEYYLEGMNYRQIAAIMGKSEKSVDNSLQRIKQKAQRLLQI